MLEYFIASLLLAIPIMPMLAGFWAGWTRQIDDKIAAKSQIAIEVSICALLILAILNQTLSSTVIPSVFRLAPLTWVMLSLVLTIGWVVTRFSQQYMSSVSCKNKKIVFLAMHYRRLFIHHDYLPGEMLLAGM